ncbi:bromodomain-containing protein 4-like [Schistocerca nitens]|uniref:bromodomain-containing protein 4-like n=1 Tax=Schistocerca nitens TaxID=7011 RepID=UPI00211773D7|nr:bromodomain-containing protein 4-like [Schistocerca nitens]
MCHRRVLLEHPCGVGESVTVILQDVSHEDMRRLLDLMYTGSTEVPGYDLPRFLCVAQALDVTLLQSGAIRICEVTTSPSAELATEPIQITTPAVPVSPPKTVTDPTGPPPNEPSPSHCHSLLLASQLRDTDVGQQTPSKGTPMPSRPCRIAMPLSTPPPTTAHSPNKGAEQPMIQAQSLQVPHCCSSETGSSLPTFTFVNMSPSAVGKQRRIQPWIPQDCCTEQQHGEGSERPTVRESEQDRTSFLVKRLMYIGSPDGTVCPETNNKSNSSNTNDIGQPCKSKAATSAQQLQQHQWIPTVQHQPPPPPPAPPQPSLSDLQQQVHCATPVTPPLLPSPQLLTATVPPYPVPTSKLPAPFQELQQPQPPLLQLPSPRLQQAPDEPESSRKPEELPETPVLASDEAIDRRTKHKCEDCGKFFSTKSSLKVCRLIC